MPPSIRSNRKRQTVESGLTRVGIVRKANSTPGSATITSHSLDHRNRPARFTPRKRAPTAGPVAPRSQRARRHSGLHSPVRRTSLTSR